MPTLRERVRLFLGAETSSADALAPKTGEMAIADTRRWSVASAGPQLYPYNPDALVQRKGLHVYDAMREDDQVKACLWLTKAAILGPGWDLEPGEEGETAEAAAEELKRQLTAANMDDTLWGLLTCLDYGWAVAEIVLSTDGGALALQAVKPRAPHHIDFRQDAYGNVEYLEQVQGGHRVKIPTAKCVILTNQPEFGNPYGRSALREAHKAWWLKGNWMQWWAMFGEKLAIPPIIGTYKAAGAGQESAVRSILSRLQAGTALTVGEAWEISTLETMRDPRIMFESAINRLDLAIARAILVPEKMGLVGGEDKGGSYSLSQTQFDVYLFILQRFRNQVQTAVQRQLVEPLSQLLDPGAPTPLFKLLPLTQDNKEAIVDLWNSALTSGAVLSTLEDENHARQLLGFPEREPEAGVDDQGPRGPGIGQSKGEKEAAAEQEATAAEAALKAKAAMAPVVGMSEATPWRPFTAHEQAIGLGDTAVALERSVVQAGRAIAEATTQAIAALRATVEKLTLTAKAVRDLTVPVKAETALRKAVHEALAEGYRTGQQTAAQEMRRGQYRVRLSEPLEATLATMAERGGFVGKGAQAFFQHKAFWVTGLLLDDILKRGQAVLFNALKQDKTKGQTLFELDRAVADFLPERDAVGRIVNVPARVENIARTNLGEAVNEGRWAAFTDPDLEGFITMVRYSAVLDNRTRDNHRAWDGVTLPVNHPAWFGPPDNRPPGGFQCRCVLVPISAADDVMSTPDAQIPTVPAADPGFR